MGIRESVPAEEFCRLLTFLESDESRVEGGDAR